MKAHYEVVNWEEIRVVPLPCCLPLLQDLAPAPSTEHLLLALLGLLKLVPSRNEEMRASGLTAAVRKLKQVVESRLL
jgi:hypothetical protein